MRLPPAVVISTEDVLREVLRFAGPADGVLSRYFREHPKLGTRERGAVAEAVYTLLRNKTVYTNFAESGAGPSIRRMALLALADTAGLSSLGGVSEEESQWITRVLQIDRSTLPEALRSNFPSWLYDLLVQRQGKEAALQLAQAFNCPAPLDLRVNALKATREQVLEELSKLSITFEPAPYAPLGIRVTGKPALQNLALFKSGAIEVQDEGSQLLSQIVGARRGEMVVDFCAGAGGKTLALGASMRNTGRLYAFDIAEKRLAKLKPRLARSGLSNVHPVHIAHENDTKIKRLARKIDRVLVDAPCSGLGTLRRNPDIKWRQSPQAIAEMSAKQIDILGGAARLVKPGGRLVYATCSILEEENEAVAAQFLAAHEDFSLVPMSAVLSEQKIALPMQEYLRLDPLHFQTDGFFAAVWERKK